MAKIVLLTIILSVSLVIILRRQNSEKKINAISRFKKKFKNKNRTKEKLANNYANKLMMDPNNDIKIGDWDEEEELRLKADIHRARLTKYGRSKMNGQMLYINNEGKVYKIFRSKNNNF